jgi:hypothetical protein
MGTCKHNRHAPDSALDSLHENQEGPHRHKCPECAYQAGFEYGRHNAGMPAGNAECTYKSKRAPKDVMDALPESQAGKGRHKCAVCAYIAGYEAARAETIGKEIGDSVAKSVASGLAPKG